jgi:hypothetical protein
MCLYDVFLLVQNRGEEQGKAWQEHFCLELRRRRENEIHV